MRHCLRHRATPKTGCSAQFGSRKTFPSLHLCHASKNEHVDDDLAALDLSAKLLTLRKAVSSKDIPPNDVVSAMNALEQSHKQDSLVSNFPECMRGRWKLVFAVPAPIESWAYIPVFEVADISTSDTIKLISIVGPLTFTFSGECSFEIQGNSYDMVFSFNRTHLEAFGWTLFEKPRNTTQKVYSFFLVQDTIAAANSSGTGGKVLLCKDV